MELSENKIMKNIHKISKKKMGVGVGVGVGEIKILIGSLQQPSVG